MGSRREDATIVAMEAAERILRAADPASAVEAVMEGMKKVSGTAAISLAWGTATFGGALRPGASGEEEGLRRLALQVPGVAGAGVVSLQGTERGARHGDEVRLQSAFSLLAAAAASALGRWFPAGLHPLRPPSDPEPGAADPWTGQQAVLGRLTTDIAHELTNPLTSILGFAQILAEGGGDEAEGRRCAGAILEEALRCRRLASTLAAFSGRSELALTVADVEAIAVDVVLSVSSRLRGRGPVVRMVPAGGGCHARVDRDLLAEALVNMVEGCVEERQAMGPAGEVRVACRSRGKEVEILASHDLSEGTAAAAFSPVAERFLLLRITAGILAVHGGCLQVAGHTGTGLALRALLPAVASPAGPGGAGGA